MSSDRAEIRVIQAGDEPEIIDGLNSFRNTQHSLEEWSWAYPPLSGGRPVVVAVADGKIFAHVGSVHSKVQVSGSTVKALALVDLFVVATDGGSGDRSHLLAQMVEVIGAEFGGGDRLELIYRLSDGCEAGGFDGPFGGTKVGLPPIDVLVRRAAARSPVRRLAYRAEPARDWEPRLDDLWRRVCPSYPAAAVRDAEMALHRHAGHPSIRRHRFLVFPRFSPRAVAFAVFETKGDRCRWVDLVWDHNEPGALDLLCHLSRRLSVQVGATEEWVILGGDPQGREHLESAGFGQEDRLQDPGLGVFKYPAGVEAGGLEACFYVTATDLDPLRRMG